MTEIDMTDDVMDIETFRQQARTWLAGNLEQRGPRHRGPRLRGVDHKTIEGIAIQRAIQRRLYDGGYAGISFPKEYGGRGLTLAHERAFNEEAEGYLLPDLGVAGGTTFGVCVRTMLAHASPEFLLRHIPKILAGEELWVQFFSEPEAGSDLAGIRTRATRDGERWILNGAKIWSSGAYYADYGMCLARTNWDVPKHRGLTWFAVSTTAPGVLVQPITEINGDAEFCQEFFDDVELSDADVIGEVDQGWRVAQTMLVFERGGGGSSLPVPSGTGGLAPDLVALARRTHRDQDPVVRQLIARAHINDYAQQQLSVRIASRMRAAQGMDSGVAAYLKLAGGTLLPIRARIGMQVGGAEALLWEHGDVEGMTSSINYLNGRVMSIAGGTNEMQRNAIGERVLGLPREPSFDTTKPFTDVVRNARHWSGQIG
jgi:alkylation response protein AidB-like acyl-CoA dehydrogenase